MPYSDIRVFLKLIMSQFVFYSVITSPNMVKERLSTVKDIRIHFFIFVFYHSTCFKGGGGVTFFCISLSFSGVDKQDSHSKELEGNGHRFPGDNIFQFHHPSNDDTSVTE